MHRRLLLTLAAAVLAVAVAAPAAAAPPRTTTIVFGACWAGMYDDTYRNTGILGQIAHNAGVIVWDLWVYDPDGASWSWAGTEVNPSWAIFNSQGREVFGGKFNLTSSILGNFEGSFIWHNKQKGIGGHSVGKSSDGAGLLWKASLGTVDLAPYLPLPPCMQYQGVTNVSEVELIAP